MASRLAERRHRPVVLIALDGDRGTGSGRSIPAFDLLGGLDACAEHLARHGGHRAAAGLEIERDRVPAFARAFADHAAATLTADDLVPTERVDAVVGGDAVGLAAAEDFERLAPFGIGNPQPSLLVAAATFGQPVAMGEGRHLRFSVHGGGAHSRAVAFGVAGGRLPVAADTPADATFHLERNVWNGAVEPRLVLRSARPARGGEIELRGEEDDWWTALTAHLDTGPEHWPPPPAPHASMAREHIDRRGQGIAGTLADLAATGEPLLVLCADAPRRADGLRGRIGGFALCSWAALERDPRLTDPFIHVVELDPPAHEHLAGLAVAGGPPGAFAHMAWGEAELRFAVSINEHEYGLRASLVSLYRVLRDGGGAAGEALHAALAGDAQRPRSPALAGRLLAVLLELGLVAFDAERRAVSLLDAERTALERSPTYRAAESRRRDAERYLSQPSSRRRRVSRSTPEGAGNGAGAGKDGAPAAPAKERKARRPAAKSTRAPGKRAASRGAREDGNGKAGAAGNGKGGARVVTRTPVGVASAPPKAPPPRWTRCRPARDGCWATCSRSSRNTPRRPRGQSTASAVASAFVFACEHHADQRRKSGEDFINHPVGVAKICAGLRQGTDALCAALLHDTVEDTTASPDEVRDSFGDKVATLVDGVTKLTGITFSVARRGAGRELPQDDGGDGLGLRVIVIKLADRLHNMRTLGALPQAEAERERQGDAGHLRADRAPAGHPRDQVGAGGPGLRHAAPAQVPRRSRRWWPSSASERERYVEECRQYLRKELQALGIEAEISGRPKHFYSIYTKMTTQGREFNEIYDLTAMRVTVDSVQGLLRRGGRGPLAVEAAARALQGLHRDAQVEPLPVAAHHGDRARGPAAGDPDPHRARCTSMAESASPRTGSTRRATPRASRDRREKLRWLRRLLEWQQRAGGLRRVRRAPEGGPVRGRGLRLHPQGRGQVACRRAPRRWTSPTRSTPTSATAAWAPRSTARWFRCPTSSSRARSSRS